MGKVAEDYDYLVDLRDRFLQSIRRGDTEEALDASVEVMAHHGIVRGDTKQLQMALAASGVIDSMHCRLYQSDAADIRHSLEPAVKPTTKHKNSTHTN